MDGPGCIKSAPTIPALRTWCSKTHGTLRLQDWSCRWAVFLYVVRGTTGRQDLWVLAHDGAHGHTVPLPSDAFNQSQAQIGDQWPLVATPRRNRGAAKSMCKVFQCPAASISCLRHGRRAAPLAERWGKELFYLSVRTNN